MSQQDLATAMRDEGWSWTQPATAKVELGKRPVRLAEAMSLARVLGTSVDALLAEPLARAIDEAQAGAEAAKREAAEAEKRAHELETQAAGLLTLRRAHSGEVLDEDAFGWAVFTAFGSMPWPAIAPVVTQLGIARSDIEELERMHAQWRRVPDGPVYFPGVLISHLKAVMPTRESQRE